MRRLKILLTLTVLAMAASAQTPISSFPYYYDWKSPIAFATSDGRTYVGGDGHWATYNVGAISQFVTNNSGWVETNQRGTLDTLFMSVDARGRSFSGAEVFTFDAMRAGSTTGTLYVCVNATVILTLDIESQLTTGTWRHFTASLPPALGNSIFTVSIVTNSNKDVSIDNTGISGGALPITLVWFKLNLSGDSPVLTWSTLSEIDNYGFYLQKSQDLENWEDIPNSFQPGNRTTVVQHFYSFTDNTLPVGRGYRLRYVDLDGTVHYSEAISVVASVEPAVVAGEFALGQNYPNPFNPVTVIHYTIGGVGGQGPGASNTSLVVYDLLGREVAVLVNEMKAAGKYEVTFDGRGMASGIYIYRLTTGSYTESKRMVLMK